MIRRPSFFSIFAKSPFKRIQAHIKVVNECVELLPAFYDLAQYGKWEEATKIAKKIQDLETEADLMKRKIQINLHSDLFLPVPRADILGLLLVQDNIANKAEDLSGLMLNRRMVFPSPLREEMRELLTHTISTSNKAVSVCSELKDLFEAGFEGVVLKLLKEAVSGLDALEKEADGIQAKIRLTIYNMEKEHPPLDVFFWYQFLHEVSALIDWAQRVGSQLLILSSR